MRLLTSALVLWVALVVMVYPSVGATQSVGVPDAGVEARRAARSSSRVRERRAASASVDSPAWAFLQQYPAQGKAPKLAQGQTITLDGSLDEPAWSEMAWTAAAFEDIAQPLHPSVVVPGDFQTQVKVRPRVLVVLL